MFEDPITIDERKLDMAEQRAAELLDKYLDGDIEEAHMPLVESVEMAGKLSKWFEREFGTTICADIRRSYLGVDLNMDIPWQGTWQKSLTWINAVKMLWQRRSEEHWPCWITLI